MLDSLHSIIQQPGMRNLISSAILILGILAARHFALKAISGAQMASSDLRRKWIIQIRNLSLFVVLLGIFIIWGQELRTVALSFVALAVAIVIALKELLLCVLGGVLRSSVRPFSIGDRIEINHMRGDVIDETILTTTILEIGPGQTIHQYTGRAITIPNSVFLNSSVFNETYTDDYVLHVFSLPMTLSDDWKQAEAILLEASREACKPFIEEARNHLRRMARKRGLDAPSVEPRISLQFPDPGRINLMVRIPAPARRKGRIEQAIWRNFLDRYQGTFGEAHRPPHGPTH